MLTKLIINHKEWLNLSVEETNILELGSGCGLLGIAISDYIKLMMLTDQPSILPHLWKNVKKNDKSQRVTVTELVWGSREGIDKDIIKHNWDYIIASDCIFNESLNILLVETLEKLCVGRNTNQNKTVVIISLELRSDNVLQNFLEEMLKKNFVIWRLPNSMYGPEFEKGFVVYIAWID